MKKTKLSCIHPPTNANKSLKQEADEEEPSAVQPQKQDEQHHAEEPYILQMPEYIIFEIFSRIPVSDMSQCRFVCKSWLRLFSDPSFTKTLFCRTPTSLVVISAKNVSRDFYLVGLDEACKPKEDVLELSTSNMRIMGSCHSFLFLFDERPDDHRLYLTNPITRESLALPKYDRLDLDTVLGFGFSPVSDVYKVFLFQSDEENEYLEDEYNAEEVIVLTVGSSVWRNIGMYSVCFGNPEDGFYFNGSVHWVGKGYYLVWGFDVETEDFQQFPPLPLTLTSEDTLLLDNSDTDSRLTVLRASLCLVVTRGQTASVWVMKDHGVQGSWSKEFEIQDESFGRIVPQVLKFTEEGQLLLVRDHQLETHSPGQKGFSRIQVDGIAEKVQYVHVHIPSLISLRDIIRG